MDDEDLAREIGDRVRALRKARGLKLHEVSERSGLTLSRLSRIELGERELSVGALVRLARALGVTVSDLLAEEPTGDPVIALVRAFPEQPDEARGRLTAALEVLAGRAAVGDARRGS